MGADQFMTHQILCEAKQGVSAGTAPAGLHKQEHLAVAVAESRREWGGRRPLLTISVSILLNLQIFWKEMISFLYQNQYFFILFY